MGKSNQAEELIKEASSKGNPYYLSEYYLTMGDLFESQSDSKSSLENYRYSLKENPFNMEASTKLQALLITTGQKPEAEKINQNMQKNLHRIKTIITTL